MRSRTGWAPVVATALVCLLVLAGCGGDDGDRAADENESIFADDTTVPDDTTVSDDTTAETTAPETTAATADLVPCELVTQEEAEAVVGTTLGPPVETDTSCAYTSPPTGTTAQVEVFVGEGAYRMLTIDRDELQHEFEPLPGVGDEALFEEGTSFVRVGSTWIAIRVVLLDDFEVYKQRLLDLTATVAERAGSA